MRPRVTQQDIETGLATLGLGPGAIVLLHSCGTGPSQATVGLATALPAL
jgi:aminoglycoside N3'-acetyltransferase